LNLNQSKPQFFGFFKKEQKKALLFEKRSKNFLVVGGVPWQRGEASIYRQALTIAPDGGRFLRVTHVQLVVRALHRISGAVAGIP
jgi:hypothetical protein